MDTSTQGLYTEISFICESLQQILEETNCDSIAVRFVSMKDRAVTQNLDQLEPVFMYTQIFKEILLDMEYDQQSVKNCTTDCRDGNYGAKENINRFENEYCSESAIWWYTFPSFIYDMLNTALRMMEIETIIEMDYFISDLHYEIENLDRQQIDSYHEKSFTVYREQGPLITDFEKLLKTKGALISFNNFVSTRKNREVSFGFTEIALTKSGAAGILFEIFIDSSVSYW